MTTLTTLWRALESNYGLLVLAGMFYLGWKMSTWKGGIENRLASVESSVENRMSSVERSVDSRLASVERSVDSRLASVERSVENRLTGVERSVDSRMSSVEKLVERYIEKTDEMYTILIDRLGHKVDQSTSPLNLNEYGTELADKVDAQKIVDRYAEAIYRETENMNAYQVQEHCFAFCNNRLLDDLEKNDRAYFDKISSVAFEEGIYLAKIMRVLGFELRNRVLQMKGMSHAKTDAHSPGRQNTDDA